MDKDKINSKIQKLNSWLLDGKSIVKNFKFRNFSEALDFVNKVGKIAEKNNHHPDIIVNYNKVRLILTTHSINGLSSMDFQVAKEIDSFA